MNAIFGEEVASTGSGEPVTQEAHLYVPATDFLGVYDTRGLEIGVDTDQLVSEATDYVNSMRRKRSLSNFTSLGTASGTATGG